jgi:hypothetical protein
VRADPRDTDQNRGHKEERLHGAYSVWTASHRNPGPATLIRPARPARPPQRFYMALVRW